MKTKILFKKGTWLEVLNDCRFTANKEMYDKEPSEKFKKSILIAEHSPIRDITYKWEWTLPHWVGVHWVRHKWECFVATQRSDRTGIDRTKLPQDQEQGFRGEANLQHLIDSMKKRLCKKASQETREYAEDLKIVITEDDENVGNVLVPSCIYRMGCPEMEPCGYFGEFMKYCIDNKLKYNTIQARYDAYNKFFLKNKKGE